MRAGAEEEEELDPAEVERAEQASDDAQVCVCVREREEERGRKTERKRQRGSERARDAHATPLPQVD